MIPWRKYDPTDRSIESHVPHLITDGRNRWIACHAKRLSEPGYTWFDDEREPMNVPVTHWAPIHLPRENVQCVEITVTEYIGDAVSSKTFEIGRESLFGIPKRSTARANRFVTNCLEEIIECINLPGEEEA